ncbi:hypothetical protein Hanom_Chr15g01358861 [Helianthus anomalus]
MYPKNVTFFSAKSNKKIVYFRERKQTHLVKSTIYCKKSEIRMGSKNPNDNVGKKPFRMSWGLKKNVDRRDDEGI